MVERNTRIRASQISSVLPDDMEATNALVNNYVPKYDSATGKFTWVAGFDSSGLETSIQKNEDNIMVNAFRIAINGSLTQFSMIDGIVDEYEDESGIDTGASTGEEYDSVNDFYKPVPGTGWDSYTKLVLHMDGSDASTTFTDEIGTHTVTAVANAQVDTAQSQFGGASALLDGTGDYLSISTHSDFDFSSSNFTIDFWVRWASFTNWRGIFAGSSDFRWGMRNSDTGELALNLSSNGSSWNLLGTFKGTKSDYVINQWYHIAFTWDGTTYRVFVDGTLDISFASSTGVWGSTGLFIGNWGNGIQEMNGWFDEFRVSKGIARWTSNFTPETSAYSEAPGDNMTLISQSSNAQSVPSSVRIVLLEEDVDSVTLNTDIKAYVSRDGGTTYSQVTLADEGNYDASKQILAGTVDISGQPSGTSMKYKIETLNNKDLYLHATGLSWD